MKIKPLKNKKNMFFLYGIGVGVLLLLIFEINGSFAKYQVTKSIPIAKGTLNYSHSDFSVMAIYVNSDNGYTLVDTIPEFGYNLNSEESFCQVGDSKIDVTINYDMDTQTLSISPMTTKGTKCYLYFDEQPSAKDVILANKTISTRSNFSSIVTSSSTNKIYSAKDDDGDSYYFAGAPTDN